MEEWWIMTKRRKKEQEGKGENASQVITNMKE